MSSTRMVEYDNETDMPILFCDLMRGTIINEGVVLTLLQTHLVEKNKAHARPIAKVMISWEHVDRTISWLSDLKERFRKAKEGQVEQE